MNPAEKTGNGEPQRSVPAESLPPPDQTTARRIRAALISLVVERGYPAITLQDLLDRAQVEPATFYHYHQNLDQCFTEIWEEIKDEIVERTAVAFLSAPNWRDGMRAAAWALCRWLQEDHGRAQIFMIELNFANEIVLASRDVVLHNYAELIHLGNEERQQSSLPRVLADGVIGSIWERISTTVNAGDFEALPDLVPQMMYVTVMPYLGVEAAEEELRRGPADTSRYQRGEI